jgi:hypothetical protein
MSLRNILQKVATKTGADLTNQEQLDYLIQEVNDVAKDLYVANDFPNSLVEQRYYMTDDTELVRLVLPAEVGKLRAVRYSDLVTGSITLVDMRPRYYYGNNWVDNRNFLKFEVQSDNAPIKREIENASRITFTLKKVETQDVIITVAGRTDFSQSFSEDVTIPAGSLSATTVNNYEDIASFTKNVITDSDVLITDIDGNEIAEIMNYAAESRYVLVQVSTRLVTEVYLQPGYTRTIEVLYKKKFRPMQKLTDEFMCPDCDNIIATAYLAEYAAHQEGQEQRAILAANRAQQQASDLAFDDEQGRQIRLEGIRSSGLAGFQRVRNSRRGYGMRFM